MLVHLIKIFKLIKDAIIFAKVWSISVSSSTNFQNKKHNYAYSPLPYLFVSHQLKP